MNKMETEFILAGEFSEEAQKLLKQLEQEDFLEQFWGCQGRVAELGLEDNQPKLDWVNGLANLVAHPEWQEILLNEAQEILAEPQVKHIVWTGMGGSVQTVHVLKKAGLLDNSRFTVHILDSTDPAQLNTLLQTIAQTENGSDEINKSVLGKILPTMLMIGVSMGMTSEEPITHLRWFTELLTQYQIEPKKHLCVMTLPNSYLHQFAEQYGVQRLNLQLDGSSNTPGRMSAPSTKVFLLPLALRLLALTNSDSQLAQQHLATVLQTAQNLYFNEDINKDAFVKLGAIIAAYSREGRNKVLLQSNDWQALFPWIEQLVEESLGKNGKGFLIFFEQNFTDYQRGCFALDLNNHHYVDLERTPMPLHYQLGFPELEKLLEKENASQDEIILAKLTALAAFFANYKKVIVAYAYLQDIVFAGQPAVEGYKRYARLLRDSDQEIEIPASNTYQVSFGSLTLDYSALLEANLISREDLAEELQSLQAKIEGQKAAETQTAQTSFNTLRDRKILFRQLQSQVDKQGFVQGEGTLEIDENGVGFLTDFVEGLDKVFVPIHLISLHNLSEGDVVGGEAKPPENQETYFSLKNVRTINGQDWNNYQPKPSTALGMGAIFYTAILRLAQQRNLLGYGDITFNGLPSTNMHEQLIQVQQQLFNQYLHIPAKIRLGPQDYHSTEQSETDGPDELVSLRLVAAKHAPIIAGNYTYRFLLAQALGTKQAMQDARRWVLMLYLPDDNAKTISDLREFFEQTRRCWIAGNAKN